jgi:hypothetical protein
VNYCIIEYDEDDYIICVYGPFLNIWDAEERRNQLEKMFQWHGHRFIIQELVA